MPKMTPLEGFKNVARWAIRNRTPGAFVGGRGGGWAPNLAGDIVDYAERNLGKAPNRVAKSLTAINEPGVSRTELLEDMLRVEQDSAHRLFDLPRRDSRGPLSPRERLEAKRGGWYDPTKHGPDLGPGDLPDFEDLLTGASAPIPAAKAPSPAQQTVSMVSSEDMIKGLSRKQNAPKSWEGDGLDASMGITPADRAVHEAHMRRIEGVMAQEASGSPPNLTNLANKGREVRANAREVLNSTSTITPSGTPVKAPSPAQQTVSAGTSSSPTTQQGTGIYSQALRAHGPDYISPAGASAPPPINMPKPFQPSNPWEPSWGAALGVGALGMLAGGAGSYATGGGFGQGALTGGLIGGTMALAGGRVGGAAKWIGATKTAKDYLPEWGMKSLTGAAKHAGTAEGRAVLFGSGALLGGTLMGGRRQRRSRGFNAHRGNRI